jgi:hypothetical protein
MVVSIHKNIYCASHTKLISCGTMPCDLLCTTPLKHRRFHQQTKSRQVDYLPYHFLFPRQAALANRFTPDSEICIRVNDCCWRRIRWGFDMYLNLDLGTTAAATSRLNPDEPRNRGCSTESWRRGNRGCSIESW